MRGLVIDTALGNIVKADRFGYVKRAMHGTRRLDFDVQRKTYAPHAGRSRRPALGVPQHVLLAVGSRDVRPADRAARCRRFVEVLGLRRPAGTRSGAALDLAARRGAPQGRESGHSPTGTSCSIPTLPLALRDLKQSGKRLLLITNSEWTYTQAMMSYAFDRFLPDGTTWRDLFELSSSAHGSPISSRAGRRSTRWSNDEGCCVPAWRARPAAASTSAATPTCSKATWACRGRRFSTWAITCTPTSGEQGHPPLADGADRSGTRRRDRPVAAARPMQETLDRSWPRRPRLKPSRPSCRLMQQRHRTGYGPVSPMPREAFDGSVARLRTRVEKLDDEIGPLAARARRRSTTTSGAR